MLEFVSFTFGLIAGCFVDQCNQADTRRKIIVGSVAISNALKDPDKARALAALLRRTVTREVDQKEITELLDDLDGVAAKADRS